MISSTTRAIMGGPANVPVQRYIVYIKRRQRLITINTHSKDTVDHIKEIISEHYQIRTDMFDLKLNGNLRLIEELLILL